MARAAATSTQPLTQGACLTTARDTTVYEPRAASCTCHRLLTGGCHRLLAGGRGAGSEPRDHEKTRPFTATRRPSAPAARQDRELRWLLAVVSVSLPLGERPLVMVMDLFLAFCKVADSFLFGCI